MNNFRTYFLLSFLLLPSCEKSDNQAVFLKNLEYVLDNPKEEVSFSLKGNENIIQIIESNGFIRDESREYIFKTLMPEIAKDLSSQCNYYEKYSENYEKSIIYITVSHENDVYTISMHTDKHPIYYHPSHVDSSPKKEPAKMREKR